MPCYSKKDGVCEVLSYAEMPSFGLRKGAIVNLDNIFRSYQKYTAIVSE
jgi:cell division ATPase FtsA